MGRPKGSKDSKPRVRAKTVKPAVPIDVETADTRYEKVKILDHNMLLKRGAGFPCVKCGIVYETRFRNFPKLQTPTYFGNDGYSPICSGCIDSYFQRVLKEYENDERRAIERVCQWLDIYWSPRAYEISYNNPTNKSPILNYIRQTVLSQIQSKGVSYDDTLRDGTIATYSFTKTDDNIEKKALEIFGAGFDSSAYQDMYKSYMSYIGPLGKTATAGQIKSARFLSMLEYRTVEAIKSGANNASQLASSFSKSLKESGFDVTQKPGDLVEEPLGVWIREIENFSPAEYVEQNDIYKDVDKMSYFERFVMRPLRNLFKVGTYEEDEELSLKDDELEETKGADD